ncbi:tRNA lysidine(34) synthetase TilS [Edaphobacillus lindanitolerans]|uniref:tRNA(Ile)-lysidine synthase n=1 Tax=Edaphobacillus lindanitolerans TaxID=550447 RepID=A0A1U7PRW8_9BACI|nr:tRNA lysidine(34) synthetase TilS [Edaphobacillus lindanitolerans]SIT93338.1 tRNA(Ile)-lysidine synthase/bifunctional protein TilS/HprT [Edaphobacillus lindanitolerans]
MDRMEREAQDFFMDSGLDTEGKRLLVACSGGPDSIALLHFMAARGPALGLQIGCAHVDHMLRGEESAEDARFVRAACADLGVPFHGTAIPVGDLVREQGGNVQDVCRSERYRFFERVMESDGYDLLATAHHADDLLETVLMKLARGTSEPAPGIPPVRTFGPGLLLRPLLMAGRPDIMDYVAANNLAFRTDPSNAKPAYTRNRFRHRIVPLLLEENREAARHFAAWDMERREDDELLRRLAEEHAGSFSERLPEGGAAVDTAKFSGMPSALQRRFIPILLDYLYRPGPPPSNRRLAALIRSELLKAEGSGAVDLPDGWVLERTYARAVFRRHAPREPQGGTESIPFPKDSWVQAGNGLRLYWSECGTAPRIRAGGGTEVLYFDEGPAFPPAGIKVPEEGDRLLLPNMESPKRVSRIFIDEKIPRHRRADWPLVTGRDGRIIAVPGIRYGAGFTRDADAGCRYIFIVENAAGAVHAQEDSK